MKLQEVLAILKKHANPKNVEGMARFGINSENTLGISIPILRNLAKKIGKNHELALELWDSKIHEARLLAIFIDDPKSVTLKQLNNWVKDIDSWDVCDQVCSNLIVRTPFAHSLVCKYVKSDKEFIKRAGFVLMAALSVHDKKAPDKVFIDFFPLIEQEANDERNFVKKAVNWALRQIGKRNKELQKLALACCERILKQNSKTAHWIANDAKRELLNKKLKK